MCKYLLDEMEMEYTDLKQFDKRECCVKLKSNHLRKKREEFDRNFNDFMSNVNFHFLTEKRE